MIEERSFSTGFSETMAKLRDADTDDLAELMKIAGGDPATFWQGTNFAGMDFGEIDIAGWNLSGCDLTGADLRRVRNITEAVFTSTTKFDDTKLPEGVTVEELVDRSLP